jgi:hypothetical protein
MKWISVAIVIFAASYGQSFASAPSVSHYWQFPVIPGTGPVHPAPGAAFKPSQTDQYHVVFDITNILWMHSFHDVDKASMEKLFSNSFKLTNTKHMLSQIRSAIHRFLAALPAVNNGDDLMIATDPANGVTVVKGGDVQQSIAAPLLARAVLNMWLGPSTVSKEFKSKLLAGN